MGILICGLNGVGKSSIGKALAERLSYRFIDDEDLYFSETDKKNMYSNPRSREQAVKILNEIISEDDKFVFAAVKGNYGEILLSRIKYLILVEVPKEVRMERVRTRSYQQFGDKISESEDLAEKENAWLLQVSNKPDNYVTEWINEVKCPVIRIDGTLPIEDNVDLLISILKK